MQLPEVAVPLPPLSTSAGAADASPALFLAGLQAAEAPGREPWASELRSGTERAEERWVWF